MGMMLHRYGEARKKNTPPQRPPGSGEDKPKTSTNAPKGQNGGSGGKRPPSRPGK